MSDKNIFTKILMGFQGVTPLKIQGLKSLKIQALKSLKIQALKSLKILFGKALLKTPNCMNFYTITGYVLKTAYHNHIEGVWVRITT
jgi:hypothetical protein